MTQYYVIVNDTTRFPLFYWQPYEIDTLRLATDNLSAVKVAFTNIQTISIVNEYEIEVARFTQFDGYSSINYLGNNYSDQLEGFTDELIVTLTKVDLVGQVQRIENQINPIIDFDAMTLEEFKDYKINQISKAGEQIIFNGTNVTLLNGVTKNFTYNLEDQSNLLNAIFIIQTLGDLTISLPYHGHAEPCELYNAKDILAVYFTLQFFSTRIQTEINMKINWIRSCATKNEVAAIDIETPLPQDWANRAAAIMGPTLELATQLQETYFGPVEPIVNEEEEPNE